MSDFIFQRNKTIVICLQTLSLRYLIYFFTISWFILTKIAFQIVVHTLRSNYMSILVSMIKRKQNIYRVCT